MLRIEIKRENDDSLKIKENTTILAISATTFDIDFKSGLQTSCRRENFQNIGIWRFKHVNFANWTILSRWRFLKKFRNFFAWACPAMPMPIYSLYRAFYLLSRKDQINSKQVNSHFIVIKRSFRASFNQCQPSEAKGWLKNAFFHILTAVNMRNLKIGSFPEKTESVTS